MEHDCERVAALYAQGAFFLSAPFRDPQEPRAYALQAFADEEAADPAFGEPLVDVARTYLGTRTGPMRGRDGNIHRGKPRDGQLAMISHLGAMISVLVGSLMFFQQLGLIPETQQIFAGSPRNTQRA